MPAQVSALIPSCSATAPINAAKTGLMLIRTPNVVAGTCLSVSRSARYGTTDASTPAPTAHSTAKLLGGLLQKMTSPTGRNSRAETPVAAAAPWTPGMRSPMVRLRRM
ncbi:hypothetical protein GCM10009589_25630 [Arthrobacter pascens]